MEQIKKYWKIALIGTIIIFLCVPLGIILNKSIIEQDQTEEIITFVVQSLLYSPINIVLILVLPVMLSVFLLNRVKGEKITKEIFIVQAVSIIIPYFINAIILLMVKFIGGFGDYLSFIDIAKWLGASVLMSAFILAISNFIGCFTKTKATHILSVCGFLFLPPLIAFAFDRVLGMIVCGYVSGTNGYISVLAEWPGMKVFELFSYKYLSDLGLWHIIIYIALIALLVYGTYKIWNKQKTYNVITMIAIYLFVMLLTLIFIEAVSMIMNIILATIVSILFAGIAYVICVLFIKKKNIKKIAISYVIYSIVVFLLICIIQGNIFGYETRIPNAEDVDSAVFSTINPLGSNQNIEYKDKENIQCIINTQRNFIENQTSIRDEDTTYYRYYVQYNLKNGDKITRSYYEKPVYIEIYDSEEFINQRYMYIVNEEARATLSQISILGLYNDKAFEIDLSQDAELFNKVAENITNDIKNQKAYRITDDSYGKYAETEGMQYLMVDVSIESSSIQNYVTYASTNIVYELVKTVQELIDSESEIIVWEEE